MEENRTVKSPPESGSSARERFAQRTEGAFNRTVNGETKISWGLVILLAFGALALVNLVLTILYFF